MIKIRFAGNDDVLTLQNLNNEVFVETYKCDSDLDLDWALSEKGSKYFSEFIENSDAYVLLAQDDGKPVGYLLAEIREVEFRKGKSVFIENMGVSANNRDQGIGGMLISELVNLANEKGIKKIYVTTYLNNNKVLEFYRKNGFSDIDITLEKNI